MILKQIWISMIFQELWEPCLKNLLKPYLIVQVWGLVEVNNFHRIGVIQVMICIEYLIIHSGWKNHAFRMNSTMQVSDCKTTCLPYGWITTDEIENSLWPGDTIWYRCSGSSLVQIMTSHLFSAKPLPNHCRLIINWTPNNISFIKKNILKISSEEL